MKGYVHTTHRQNDHCDGMFDRLLRGTGGGCRRRSSCMHERRKQHLDVYLWIPDTGTHTTTGHTSHAWTSGRHCPCCKLGVWQAACSVSLPAKGFAAGDPPPACGNRSQTCRPAEPRAADTHLRLRGGALHCVTADSKTFGIRISKPVRSRPHHAGARFNVDKCTGSKSTGACAPRHQTNHNRIVQRALSCKLRSVATTGLSMFERGACLHSDHLLPR